MSALRKAGIWLGLVEEEDRRDFGDYDDEFGDEDDDYAPPVRPRSTDRTGARPTLDRARYERDGRAEREARVDRESRPDRDPRPDRAPRTGLTESRLIDARPDPDARESRLAREHRLSEDGEPHGLADRDRRGPDRDGRSGELGSVRPLTRPGSTQSGALSFATRDNLALAPQPQPQPQPRLRERAGGGDESHRYQIITLHPTTYPEARMIGEHFRDGNPVIMNLTEMAEPDAKRLVDFAAGLAFGLRGSMERVTNRVFLLSPPNIQVSAEDKARIAEGGFFDQG